MLCAWDVWNNSCTPTQPWGGVKVKNERFPLVTELRKPQRGLTTSSPGQLGKVLRAQKGAENLEKKAEPGGKISKNWVWLF